MIALKGLLHWLLEPHIDLQSPPNLILYPQQDILYLILCLPDIQHHSGSKYLQVQFDAVKSEDFKHEFQSVLLVLVEVHY